MKKTFSSALLITLVFLSITAHAQEISNFQATTSGGKVILEWNSGRENGVLGFRVQRSLDGSSFYNVITVDPAGDFQSYRYEDDDLFKGVISTYYYRIEVILRGDRSNYSRTVEVIFVSSNINRTWGSIKALFK